MCKRKDAFALGIAVSRAYPLYNRKTTRTTFGKKSVLVEFLFVGDKTDALDQSEIDCLTSAAESVRLAAKIVDAPCNEMTTDHFLEVLVKYCFSSLFTLSAEWVHSMIQWKTMQK